MAKDKVPMIDPREWRIASSLVVEGVIYSRGEPMPKISVEQAMKELRAGNVVCLKPEGPAAEVPPPVTSAVRPSVHSMDVNGILRHKAVIVMQIIRQRGCKDEDMQAVLDLAVKTGREEMLIQALRMALKMPFSDTETAKARGRRLSA